MSRELLNTLFVMTQEAYVRLEGDTLRVEAEGKTISQVPLHHIGSVVLFGRAMISPAAMHRCAEDGRSVTFLDSHGRFKARLVGPVCGNILLRQSQYAAYDNENRKVDISRCIVAGKLQNSRVLLMRAARESKSDDISHTLNASSNSIAELIRLLPSMDTVEKIRGCEGQGAACYFNVFDNMIVSQRTDFSFGGRNRRPPRDRVNALLSFAYALLANDCTSALEGVGLDPQLGYLHAIRSGKPALALDLMEEFRPVIAERLVLSLINLKQIKAEHFSERPGHSVMMNDEGKKIFLVAYQKRKQEEISHPQMKAKVLMGLIPHLQARILARYLRNDIDSYIPFIPR